MTQKRLNELNRNIEKHETRLTDIDNEMTEFYSDYETLDLLSKEEDSLSKQLEIFYEEWINIEPWSF